MDYPSHVLEHYRHPRHRGGMKDPDGTATCTNPLCGDEVTMYVRRDGPRLRRASFEAVGCAICIASADLAIEAAWADPAALRAPLSEVPKAIAMDLPPGRVRCATLGWEALGRAWQAAEEGLPSGESA